MALDFLVLSSLVVIYPPLTRVEIYSWFHAVSLVRVRILVQTLNSRFGKVAKITKWI